eukprot:TRINITY_DN3072_c0_g1_i2.p1 TRINITY_DN3072_c0_g1~~TRINITY_DN3072_c0_g1_i2.p1  ORF type:complete len:176 (-),score=28.25 TRINITY_DN3072_c0_g1_i2:317-844(-)
MPNNNVFYGQEFTDQMNGEITRIFTYYDVDGSGYLPLPLAVKVWRLLGFEINPATVEKTPELEDHGVSLKRFIDRCKTEHIFATHDSHLMHSFVSITGDSKKALTPEIIDSFMESMGKSTNPEYTKELCLNMKSVCPVNPFDTSKNENDLDDEVYCLYHQFNLWTREFTDNRFRK